MPLIPWDIRDPETGLFPEYIPGAGQLNDAIGAICPLYNELEQWQQNIWSDFTPGAGGAGSRLLTGRNLWGNICAPHGGTPRIPPGNPQVPTFTENCATFGVLRGRQNIGNAFPQWLVGEFFWTCTDNIGIPVSQPVWKNIAGGTWGYVITFLRPDGSTVELSPASTTFGDFPERCVIDEISVTYCPSCNIPDPPVPPPTVPRTRPPGQTPIPPAIDIPISIDQPNGLPPITISIPFRPVVDLTLPQGNQPLLTLEPNIEIAPEFAFAPTFEFNLGGLSIGGGGYAEPRQDVEDMQNCDCPDPCPPAGGTVDYQRIQDSVAKVVASRWRLGSFTRDPSYLAYTSYAAAHRIQFFSDTIAVQIQVDATLYVGGGTPTVNGVEGVGYYGWYMFNALFGDNTGGERRYLSSQNCEIEVPPATGGFSVYAQNGAKVRVRQIRFAAIPPA